MIWILLFILIFLVSTLACTTFKIWDDLGKGTYWPIICGFAISVFWVLTLFIACNY